MNSTISAVVQSSKGFDWYNFFSNPIVLALLSSGIIILAISAVLKYVFKLGEDSSNFKIGLTNISKLKTGVEAFVKKLINSITRKFMDTSFLDKLIHGLVISAYVATFQATELQKLGLLITQNTSTTKSRFLGNPSNPVYPEVVIWKPDNQFQPAGSGKAVLVACIETQSTLETNVRKWIFLASMGIIFNLVVPENDVDRTKNLLKSNNIDLLVKLQKYTFNTTTKRYDFLNV